MDKQFFKRLMRFSLRKVLVMVGRLPKGRLSDTIWIRLRYWQQSGVALNLKAPQGFNEKIQWLKLYNRQPEYTVLADKFSVRDVVKEKIGEEYLIPLIAVFDSAEEIDFSELPERFILKGSHGSGMNVICDDRAEFNVDTIRQQFRNWMAQNYYHAGREWVYKSIQPRIVCEQLIEWDGEGDLPDYKFFCFNGVPRYIQVDVDRFAGHTRNIYDIQWVLLPFELHYPQAKRDIPRPDNLTLMIDLAKTLSSGIPFVRVDFYDTGTHVYFGEMTFYPGNGLEVFSPKEWDLKLGACLELQEK